jgi:hypothetical protein
MDNALVETLRFLLKNNVVCFTYKKIDGTMRVARGTRNLSIASALGYSVPSPKNGEQPYSYYDLDCEGWRSYRPENLISIDKVMPYAPVEEKEKPVVVGAPVHTPVREIPVGGIPKEEIRKAMDDLGKEISFAPVGGLLGGFDKGTPVGGKETRSIVSPNGDMTSLDDFARLVAKYVADEIFSRITLK